MAKRQGFMLAYPFEEKRLNKWKYPVLVQPKLDGIRCGATQEIDGEVNLTSSTQEPITSVPHINSFLQNISDELNIDIPLIDGELYIHGKSFEDINSITSRTVNFHPDFQTMEYHVFDLCEEQLVQTDRLIMLWEFLEQLSENCPIKKVPTCIAYSFEELWNHYQRFLSDGYEGIIVRHPTAPYIRRRSTQVMKFKPKKDDWYTVVGIEQMMVYKMSLDEIKASLFLNGYPEDIENISALTLRSLHPRFSEKEPKPLIGSLVCEGSTGDIFTVGSGLTDKDREKYWNINITGWLCHVSYQHITPGKGVPRFPVFIELVNPKEVM